MRINIVLIFIIMLCASCSNAHEKAKEQNQNKLSVAETEILFKELNKPLVRIILMKSGIDSPSLEDELAFYFGKLMIDPDFAIAKKVDDSLFEAMALKYNIEKKFLYQAVYDYICLENIVYKIK